MQQAAMEGNARTRGAGSVGVGTLNMLLGIWLRNAVPGKPRSSVPLARHMRYHRSVWRTALGPFN